MPKPTQDVLDRPPAQLLEGRAPLAVTTAVPDSGGLAALACQITGPDPLACRTDKIDAWVLAELSRRDLVPAIWLPTLAVRAERERARWRFTCPARLSSIEL